MITIERFYNMDFLGICPVIVIALDGIECKSSYGGGDLDRILFISKSMLYDVCNFKGGERL